MEGISPIRGNMVNDLHLVLKKLYIYGNHKQVIHFSAKSKETWYF